MLLIGSYGSFSLTSNTQVGTAEVILVLSHGSDRSWIERLPSTVCNLFIGSGDSICTICIDTSYALALMICSTISSPGTTCYIWACVSYTFSWVNILLMLEAWPLFLYLFPLWYQLVMLSCRQSSPVLAAIPLEVEFSYLSLDSQQSGKGSLLCVPKVSFELFGLERVSRISWRSKWHRNYEVKHMPLYPSLFPLLPIPITLLHDCIMVIILELSQKKIYLELPQILLCDSLTVKEDFE